MKCRLKRVMIAVLASVVLMNTTVYAQQTSIPILTKNNAIVLQVENNKDVNIIYFGEKLNNETEYFKINMAYKQAEDPSGVQRSAYSSSGSRNLMEPAISVTHADGNNSLDLNYVSSKVEKVDNNVTLTSVLLKDPVYPFEVALYYKTYFNEDIVEQWSEIRHNEKGNVVLQKYGSANLHLKAESYYLKNYHGDWAKEMQPEETKLTHGIRTLDTKLGTRANLFMPSVFMVSLDRPATEDEGKVL